MPGLERLGRKLFGTTPQIDLDRHLFRARVPEPMTFDFFALADGIRRANVGVAAIEVAVPYDVKNGTVIIARTGQEFPIQGVVTPGKGFRVQNWENSGAIRVEILP